jgi:hypothetical protein
MKFVSMVLVLFCFVVAPFAFAQSKSPDVGGVYRGFSQSTGDPNIKSQVELNINFQEPPEPEFSGVLTMGTTQPFRFSGKVDAAGNFKGKGTGPDGSVSFTGNWMDEGTGGALVLATFKFVSVSGATIQGHCDLLRNFADPPEPERPFDVTGTWNGTSQSALVDGSGNLCLQIMQDHDPFSGRPKTGFQGTETIDVGTRNQRDFDFVGTIDQRGHFIMIGAGLLGRFLVGGQEPPEPEHPATAVYSLNSADGSVDIGGFAIHQLPPGPCAQ